jgi:hypothetical protein
VVWNRTHHAGSHGLSSAGLPAAELPAAELSGAGLEATKFVDDWRLGGELENALPSKDEKEDYDITLGEWRPMVARGVV